MSGWFRSLGRILGFSKAQPTHLNEILQNAKPRDLTRFAEGDRVLVDGSRLTFLTRNAKFDVAKGQVPFNDIIGKSVNSAYVRGSKGSLHKVEFPSLEDYVTLTPRLVTPVYSSYASSIVSLLDIHPEPCDSLTGDGTSRKLEILEAGTGHGSLTLHLARAIAAANPPPPSIDLPTPRTKSTASIDSTQGNSEKDAVAQAWAQWKEGRRATIHTVEAVPANSIHAEKMVRGFRRGLYWPHVDFYTGDVKDWLVKHRSHNDEKGFLDYVLLDMPGVHEQLAQVSSAMRDGAKLLVFVPSITQIGDCVRIVSEESLPLEKLKVVELGEGISSGRKWDVRLTSLRRGAQASIGNEAGKEPGASDEVDPSAEQDPDLESEAEPEQQSPSPDMPGKDHQPVMVCRPLVGERTYGGGFVALFRKTSPASADLAVEWRRGRTGKARKRARMLF